MDADTIEALGDRVVHPLPSARSPAGQSRLVFRFPSTPAKGGETCSVRETRASLRRCTLWCEAHEMTFTINDLVVHPGTAQGDRVIRVVRIEPWPVVVNGGLVEGATERCYGTMIVFDRLVPTSPAPVHELRLATVNEINDARRLDLLPPAIDGGDDLADGLGDREPRGPRPRPGSGSVAVSVPEPIRSAMSAVQAILT
jgi:hypothetical protein